MYDIEGKAVKLQIWDSSGRELFRSFISAYYRGANGVIVVYDATSRESFNHVEMWMDENRRYAASGVSILLVGNKIDLESSIVVSYDEGKELADRFGAKFLETSAKTRHNIEEAFMTIAYGIKYKQDVATHDTMNPQE